MNNPLVSIIIPCYQAARTLSKTIEDIFAQTYRPLEIIAVNDGSRDATSAELQTYTGHITIINQENKGAAAARNTGFKKSRGSFVLFCDADVRLQPDMVSAMVQTLQEHPKAAYAYCNFRFGMHTFDLFPFDAARLRKENYISTMSMIRREKFIGFDERLSRLQDWNLWLRMLDRGETGVWVPKRLFSAPLRPGGISAYRIRDYLTILKRRLRGHR